MMSENIENSLIELQRAVTPEQVWKACVRLMRAALPVYHVLMGLPSLGVQPVFLRTTLPCPNSENYFGRLAQLAPLGEVIGSNPGLCVSRMSDHLDPRGTRFYEEFMKPEGWLYSAAMLFWTDDGKFLGQLAVNRTPEQGDLTDGELNVLRSLRPHVQAAVERILALENGAAARRGLEHSLRALPVPMLVVGWDLAVSYVNNAAREAIVTWLHGPDTARAFSPSKDLPDDLREACAQLKVRWNQALQDDSFQKLARNLVLNNSIMPEFKASVEIAEPNAGRSLQPSFVIQLLLPPAENSEVAHALSKLSQLTPSEYTVARLAAAGNENTQIARDLNISASTVRTHLRHIFRKVGISTRSKLAPLFARIERP